MIKRIEKKQFFQETISPIWSPMNIVKRGVVGGWREGGQSTCLHFLCYEKGNEKSLVICSYWKLFKRILETFVLSRPYGYSQYLPVVAGVGDNLPRGKVSPHPLNPHAFFHFYVMIKGMGSVWLFEVSENPSRGYLKQFLLSGPYEHSQYLPLVGRGGGAFRNFNWPGSSHSLWSLHKKRKHTWGLWGGDTLPRDRLSPTPATTGKYWLCP